MNLHIVSKANTQLIVQLAYCLQTDDQIILIEEAIVLLQNDLSALNAYTINVLTTDIDLYNAQAPINTINIDQWVALTEQASAIKTWY